VKFNDSLYRLMNSPAKIELLKFLLSDRPFPDMSERELARVLKIPHAAVNRAMADFEAANLVYYRAAGGAYIWNVNKAGYAYASLKKITGVMETITPPYEKLLEVLRGGLSGVLVVSAVLFGSIPGKKEKPRSDIDFFVLVKNETGKKKAEKALEKTGSKCVSFFGNQLSPYILTEKEYRAPARAKLAAEINKGVKIV